MAPICVSPLVRVILETYYPDIECKDGDTFPTIIYNTSMELLIHVLRVLRERDLNSRDKYKFQSAAITAEFPLLDALRIVFQDSVADAIYTHAVHGRSVTGKVYAFVERLGLGAFGPERMHCLLRAYEMIVKETVDHVMRYAYSAEKSRVSSRDVGRAFRHNSFAHVPLPFIYPMRQMQRIPAEAAQKYGLTKDAYRMCHMYLKTIFEVWEPRNAQRNVVHAGEDAGVDAVVESERVAVEIDLVD